MRIIRKNNDGSQLELEIPKSSSLEDSTIIEIEQGQSIIIVGANGSGKSRFCVQTEMLNLNLVHRIAAQKNLVFEKQYSLSSYEDAKSDIFYGTTNNDPQKRQRWGWDDSEKYVKPVSDCSQAITAFFAQKNKDDEARSKQAVQIIREHQNITELAPSVAEQLIKIWDQILPNRELKIGDLKIKTSKNKGQPYDARFMSDGERDVLYYLAVCLCLPQNIFVILDEPENHIHNSIINKLFSLLEKERPDLTFIYATHNLEFAAEHPNTKKLWFENYDGSKWDYHILGEEEELPEQLLLEVLGAKEKVLLVEGTRNSLDTKLYQAYYKDYKVIGCGGCQNVINFVKAFNSHTLHTHYDVKGIVDRDYRPEKEIDALRKEGIYVCEVAEVENLFIVPEIMQYMASLLGTDGKINDCIRTIIDMFEQDLQAQIVAAINAAVKFQINKFSFEKRDLEAYKKEISDLQTSIKLDEIITTIEKRFLGIEKSGDYPSILMIYNQKNLIYCILKMMGYSTADIYRNKVVACLQNEESALIDALSRYLPQINL